MHQPTVSDVAQAAGVSTATVSRALSGRSPVAEKTRKRVEQAAHDLGYTGNSIARALRRKHSDIVGMIVPGISNPFFTALVESVEHELQRVGKTLFLCDSQGDVALEAKRIWSLRESHVEGIIISPCHGEDSATAINAIPPGTPVVQLDQYVTGTTSDWVGLDDDTAMRLLLEHLAEIGVKTAVFASSATTNSSTQARLDGFRKYAAATGIDVGPSGVMLGRFSTDWGEEVVRHLLQLPLLPDVIICGADIIAFGAIRALTSAGVTVPDQVKVTGFDDVSFASIISPSLTTIRQPTRLLAGEAVRLLTQRTRTQLTTHAKVAFAPELVIRESSTMRVQSQLRHSLAPDRGR